MNALRTLPILNRPSRPASPAPQVTATNAVGSTAPGAGNSQNRSRSLSRNLADKVAGVPVNGINSATGAQPTTANHAPPSGVLTPQVTGKKTPSPPPSHPPTPRNIATPLPGTVNGDMGPPAAYMDVIGTRLNDSVNKSTAGVDYKAKKGIKPHTGWNLGEAVIR